MIKSMKNPCLDCYLLDEDKNNPECLDCVQRLEYVKSLGGDFESVPSSRSMDGGYEADRNIEVIEEEGMDMTPSQEIEIVIKDICEDCYTDVARVKAGGRRPEDSMARRLIIKRLISDEFNIPQAKIAPLVGVTYAAVNQIAKSLKDDDSNNDSKPAVLRVRVDFTDYPDLHKFLMDESGYQFRAPEDHIIFMLRRERDGKVR